MGSYVSDRVRIRDTVRDTVRGRVSFSYVTLVSELGAPRRLV